jgi:hypothetical protein
MARAWPFLGAGLYAGVVAAFMYLEYARLIARHAWTGATITMGLGVILACVASVIGWFLGLAVRDLLAPGTNKKRAAFTAAAILLFSVSTGWSMAANRKREIRLQAIREELLTPERITVLLAGSQDEIRALSWNRSVPSAVLAELASSPDYVVRANVAAHPALPAELAAKLALDSNESVRQAAEYHPSRRK